MQRGVAKGLKVPCLFMITEVCIRCQKNPGGWYTAYTRVYPPNTPLGRPTHVFVVSRRLSVAIMCKHDVIHKTGSVASQSNAASGP